VQRHALLLQGLTGGAPGKRYRAYLRLRLEEFQGKEALHFEEVQAPQQVSSNNTPNLRAPCFHLRPCTATASCATSQPFCRCP